MGRKRVEVVGSDIDDTLLGAARELVDAEGLANVTLATDDLFDSRLEPESFDLVHARFQLAPLGRMKEQVAAYRRLVKNGGWDRARRAGQLILCTKTRRRRRQSG